MKQVRIGRWAPRAAAMIDRATSTALIMIGDTKITISPSTVGSAFKISSAAA